VQNGSLNQGSGRVHQVFGERKIVVSIEKKILYKTDPWR